MDMPRRENPGLKVLWQNSLGKHQIPRFLKGEFLCEEALAVADIRNCGSSEGVSRNGGRVERKGENH